MNNEIFNELKNKIEEFRSLSSNLNEKFTNVIEENNEKLNKALYNTQIKIGEQVVKSINNKFLLDYSKTKPLEFKVRYGEKVSVEVINIFYIVFIIGLSIIYIIYKKLF